MQQKRKINGIPIGDEYPCFIIAEIGQNHQGDIEFAKELITLAKECGANCVKFQKSSLTEKFTENALNSPYESINSFGSTYGEHKARLEFSYEEYKELQNFAEKQIGIMFTASAMDKSSAEFLLSLDVPFIKIGSGDANNFPLIEYLANTGKPVILSTGMQEFETVKKAVLILRKSHSNFGILHCVSAYPTPLEDVNLSVMKLYADEFPEIIVGYSGHESGVFVPIAAVACGAKIVEKHFTKDKTLKGTDHVCSLNPFEFKAMVDGIREIEKAIGFPIKTFHGIQPYLYKKQYYTLYRELNFLLDLSSKHNNNIKVFSYLLNMKRILPSEIPCLEKLGKSIVTLRKINEGSPLSLKDLCIKVSRPKSSISPQDIYKIVGKKVNKTIEADNPIMEEDLMYEMEY